MTKRKRLDTLLVEKGLVVTLSKAKAHTLAGDVVVNDQRVDKPGTLFDENVQIRLRNQSLPYVSRGGLKLEAALEKWPIQIDDTICIDVGASTGGFTDVLLQRGARLVYAVDVGYNQLAYSLRIDPRVKVMEKTHVLHLGHGTLDPTPSISVIDVSFISLAKVLPKVCELITTPGTIYALIKPQFEVSDEHIGKGGIVRDEMVRLDSVNRIVQLGKRLNLESDGVIESPIQGADGNVEYLIRFKKS